MMVIMVMVVMMMIMIMMMIMMMMKMIMMKMMMMMMMMMMKNCFSGIVDRRSLLFSWTRFSPSQTSDALQGTFETAEREFRL